MNRLRSQVTLLSDAEVQSIHDASLRILEGVGVRMPHAGCLAICSELGASVDMDSSTVRVPAAVMEGVLGRIRSVAEPVEADDGVKPLEGRISTQAYLVDYRTNTRRLGTTDDIKKGIALVQTLKNITTCNAAVIPSDVPPSLSDVVSFELIYRYSRKPGGTYVLSPFSAKYILAMARLMNQAVPFLLDTVSPLQFQASSLEIAAMFASERQPITISSMVMAGGTGPVTLAGTLVLANAETLAGLFLVFGLTGKAPPFTSIPHSFDLRTMMCSFGSPNQALFGIATAQLARHYGLIPECNSGLTDALRPDFQAGFEKSSTAIFSALAGVRTIGAQGIVGSDQGFSFEQLVLDNEWLTAFNYVINGLEFSEEAVAEELIRSVGMGGSYLGEEHTALNMRGSYLYSRLFNRSGWEGWQAGGAKDMLARAAERVDEATAGYQSQDPACTPSQQAALEEVLGAAREEAAFLDTL